MLAILMLVIPRLVKPMLAILSWLHLGWLNLCWLFLCWLYLGWLNLCWLFLCWLYLGWLNLCWLFLCWLLLRELLMVIISQYIFIYLVTILGITSQIRQFLSPFEFEQNIRLFLLRNIFGEEGQMSIIIEHGTLIVYEKRTLDFWKNFVSTAKICCFDVF